LGGNSFGVRFANINTCHVARFGYLAPLAQKALIVGESVVRRRGAAGDNRGIDSQQ